MEIQMLKANNAGLEVEPTIPRKHQEFISHTLLAPEYIRDSNNFIIDLMEHPAVFQKAVVHVSPTVANAGDFVVKDALSSDLNFQTPLFQFVNKPSEINRDIVGNVSGVSVATTTDATPADFMALNGDFLSTANNKTFCGTVTDNHVATERVDVQQLPPLSLLAEPNVTLNDPGDILYTRSIARKVLPHKKRISRKLKTGQDYDEPVLSDSLEQNKLPVEPMTIISGLQFSCELCGHATSSQLDFFAHLKQHYEPRKSHKILAAMKTSLDALEPEKNRHNTCAVNKKSVGEASNVDQAFNDVNLNFANFHNVEETGPVILSSSHNMKVINSDSIDKCINYVSQVEATPLKGITAVEVEFSDNEDMLEGIRNVVDKVSIEDTCDDIDLMSTTGIRAPWFTNDNFSGITFKSKSFGAVSFSGTLETLPATEGTTEVSPAVPKEQVPCSNHLLKISEPRSLMSFPDSPTEAEEADVFYTTNTDCTNAQASVAIANSAPHEPLYHTLPDEETSSASDVSAQVGDGDDCCYEDATNKESLATWKRILFCTECHREFNSNNALKYHLRTHSAERPYQCDVCNKGFLAHGNLKAHKRTHTGDKPFQCEYCERKFRQWGDLKYHTISIHTSEKSYQCEFCGKAFSRKYSLVVHRRIHTSERNYKCDFCGKCFRASTYLQNHRKIHTGEKPHECNVCKKRFRLTGDLRRHMRIHQSKVSTIKEKKRSQPKAKSTK